MKKGFIPAVSFVLAGSFLFAGCSSEPAKMTAEEQQGYRVYKAFCSKCHRLQSPKMHTADEWPSAVEKMQRYMTEKKQTPMSPEEKEQVLVFLNKQSRQ